MKATGIVRRIDELGRIVVPKEIRRNLRMREGDPIEIFTEKNGEVILRKYSPLGELSEFAQQYADAAARGLGCAVCISDRDQIIAVAGVSKKEWTGRSIHRDLEHVIRDRQQIVAKRGDNDFINITNPPDESFDTQVIQTIICEGDAIGSVVLQGKNREKILGEAERMAAKIAADFLGKQMES